MQQFRRLAGHPLLPLQVQCVGGYGAAIASSYLIPKSLPNFRCLPDLVSGTPMDLEILDLAAEMPSSRLQLKPPMFI